MKRDLRLDGVRGFLLAVMTVDHLGGLWSRWLFEAPGFVSAAEGFVFLSGFVSGLVYTGIAQQGAQRQVVRKALGRVSTIYRYHVAMLGLLLAVATLFESYAVYWQPRVPLFYERPLAAFAMGMGLLYQPYIMNILPMYCIYLAAVPFLLYAFFRGYGGWILMGSSLLWFGAQFEVGSDILRTLPNGLPLYTSAFDLRAWQLLFVLGVWFGCRYRMGQPSVQLGRAPLGAVCALVVACFFAARHLLGDAPPDAIMAWANRERLGPLRLVNFFALSYLVAGLLAAYPTLFTSRWLTFLGQHSLEVYAFHAVVVYLLDPVRTSVQASASFIGVILDSALTIGVLASLTIPAWLHSAYRKRLVGSAGLWTVLKLAWHGARRFEKLEAPGDDGPRQDEPALPEDPGSRAAIAS